MTTSEHHYHSLLAPVYSWMMGDREAAEARQREILMGTCLSNAERGAAVDLGAGNGLQSIPLAQMGFTVTAVDLSVELLGELDAAQGDLAIRTSIDDIVAFTELITEPVKAILCMGDTLTHLPSHESVRTLIRSVSRALAPGAPFIVTFRDYASRELTGTRRFLPVRSDETRIMTCFLEYRPETVEVHDLVYERLDGVWEFRASSYPKLRLDPTEVAQSITEAGIRVLQNDTVYGMARIVAVGAAGEAR